MPRNSNRREDRRRGREAKTPSRIPARGWRDVLLRVKNEIGRDTLSLVAAGVGFYAFLSLFPAITALLSIYGLVAEPTQVTQQVGQLQGTVPSSALQLVQGQIKAVAQTGSSTLGISLLISVLIALYSASKGTGAMITALNIAYDEDETRGFIKLKAITLLFTFAGIVVMLLLLVAISLPAYLAQLGLPGWLDIVVRIGRWIIVLALMMAVLAATFAFAPSRARPTMKWATPGAIVAAIVWMIASIAFSFYIAHFGSYSKTYGSAAAIVILMTWFWLSAFLILIGAEINAELEGQTRKDSTAGQHKRRGERGAVVADEVRDAP